MRDNFNNFSAHIRTNIKIQKEEFDINQYTITSLSGCNGPILSANERFLYLFIPKLEINRIEKESKLSFIDIINEISKFGFKCTIIESDSKYSYNYYNRSISINDSIIIELDLNDYNNSRHRYYAFCMYRHFYYCQNTLLKYLKIIEENDTESIRIKKLSWATGAANNNGFTFLPSFIVNDYTIEYLLSKFDKLTNSIGNMGVFPNPTEFNNYDDDIKKFTNEYQINKDIADLKYKFISLENIDIKKYNNIFSDVIIPGYIRNINTYLGRWEKYIAVKESEKLDKYYIKKNVNNLHTNYYITVNDRTVYNSEGLYVSSINAAKNCYYFDIDNYIKDNDTRKSVTVDIRSRHPSHSVFRNAIKSKKITLIRLGSVTPTTKKYDLVINKEDAIRNSSSKLLMKRCFNKHNVITPDYVYADTIENVILQLNNNISFPIIAKNIMGSRGTGNYKIDTVEELNRWARNRTITNYIFEKFKNFAKEYRIHVSTEGVFLMWRKLRRNDTPDNQKWFFNNINCNWISESNSLFDAPINIETIKIECIKALNSVGLDFGACDVRVQSNLTKEGNIRKNAPEFSIIEINSAPSMSPVTTEAYFKEFIKLIDKK